MITVSIGINGSVIKAISAYRFVDAGENKVCQYRTTNNRVIEHIPKDGAIALAHKMLDLIKEQEEEDKQKLIQKVLDDELQKSRRDNAQDNGRMEEKASEGSKAQ
jgi:hypothetical protein